MEFIADEARNLSDHNVTRRLRWGIILLLTALVLAAAFERLGLPRSSRVWLFVPFFLSGNAFFQAIFKTCGFSAIHWRYRISALRGCQQHPVPHSMRADVTLASAHLFRIAGLPHTLKKIRQIVAQLPSMTRCREDAGT